MAKLKTSQITAGQSEQQLRELKAEVNSMLADILAAEQRLKALREETEQFITGVSNVLADDIKMMIVQILQGIINPQLKSLDAQLANWARREGNRVDTFLAQIIEEIGAASRAIGADESLPFEERVQTIMRVFGMVDDCTQIVLATRQPVENGRLSLGALGSDDFESVYGALQRKLDSNGQG